MTQIVSLLQAGEENYEKVSKIFIDDRAIFMEFKNPGSDEAEIEKWKDLTPPRMAKTHLPYEFVSKWVERDGAKAIVVIRNPKDTLVSLFHFYRTLAGKWIWVIWLILVISKQVKLILNYILHVNFMAIY